MKVQFLKSAVLPQEYPFPYKPEVAIVGRSNAGKSSFINALVGQKIAKVSQTPGKTRLLNFFAWGEAVYIVDMPGYGFAKGDRQEVQSWRKMIETYLRERKSLKGVLLIMDIRREWSPDEELLKEWLTHHKIPWAVVLNKADKLSRSGAIQAGAAFKKSHQADAFVVSSMKQTGLDDVENHVLKDWASK